MFGGGDHFIGYAEGLPDGLRHLGPTLKAIVAARPDAVTMHKGIATAAWEPYAGRVPLIVQSSLVRPDDRARQQAATPEDAVRLGADAFAVAAFVRGDTEADYLRVVADCVREASRFEMPVICHIYPREVASRTISFQPEDIAWAARCAVEVGAAVVQGALLRRGAGVRPDRGDSPVPVGWRAGGPKSRRRSAPRWR